MSISQDIIFRLENSKLYTQRGFPQDVNRGGRFLADLQATKQTNGYKETSKLPQRQFAEHPPAQDTRAVNEILQNVHMRRPRLLVWFQQRSLETPVNDSYSNKRPIKDLLQLL